MVGVPDRDGDHYILNGTKRYITNGPEAGLYTVMARTDQNNKGAGGITAFIVEGDTPGLIRGKPDVKMGQKGAHVCDITFEDCRVPAENIIGGQEGQGFKTAMKVLDRGRLHISAVCVGVADIGSEPGPTGLGPVEHEREDDRVAAVMDGP